MAGMAVAATGAATRGVIGRSRMRMEILAAKSLEERVRTFMSAARANEKRLECPRCHYVLTEEDRILCRVAGRAYCPHCWSAMVEEQVKEPANRRTGGKK